MGIYERQVAQLQMAKDNLLHQRERLMGKQDPISLAALDEVTRQLTHVGRELMEFEILGKIMPSLKA